MNDEPSQSKPAPPSSASAQSSKPTPQNLSSVVRSVAPQPVTTASIAPRHWSQRPLSGYLVAVLSVAVVWAIRTGLDPIFRELQPFALFYIPVLIMGRWFGTGPAILATALGWLAGDWFFSPPRHSIFAGGTQEGATSIVYLAISTVLVSITHLMRGSAARIRQSEERLRIALDAAQLGTWDYDLLTHDVSGDARAAAMFGLTTRRLQFTQFLNAVHPDDRQLVAQGVRNAISPAGSGDYHMEHRVVWPDGSLQWVAVDGKVQFQGQGPDRRAIHFIGTSLDITRRKQAEAAINQAVDRYERQVRLFDGVASTTPDFVYIFDLQGRFLYANRRLLEVWGMKLEEAVGKTCRELGYEQWHHDMHMREIAQVIQTKRSLKGEVPFKAPRTGIFGVYEYIFTPVIAPDGEVEMIAGTTRDVTARKHAESELQHARDKLAEVNADLDRTIQERTAKLRETIAELETFSYALVHDMRAPLRAMTTYANVIEEEAGARLQSPELNLLRKLKSACNRMDQLITDSLNYSKVVREELPIGTVNLGSLLRDLVETYPNFQPPAAEIHIEFQDLLVRANIAALTQVFSNLLGNAVKFVAPGVHPHVRVWAQPLNSEPTPGITEHELPPPSKDQSALSSSVLVCVEDNGIGIPKESQHKIFGMFERLHRADEYPGTGIGLAIVKKSLERIGGQIRVESEPGRGSRFYVELPFAELRARYQNAV